MVRLIWMTVLFNGFTYKWKPGEAGKDDVFVQSSEGLYMWVTNNCHDTDLSLSWNMLCLTPEDFNNEYNNWIKQAKM